MPYVTQDHRDAMEIGIEWIHNYIACCEDDKRDGLLNYAVSELVGRTMKPAKGWSYHFIHRAYGVFMAAGAEFYRRIAAPYELNCIVKNGDIPAYYSECLKPAHVSPEQACEVLSAMMPVVDRKAKWLPEAGDAGPSLIDAMGHRVDPPITFSGNNELVGFGE